MLRLVLADSEPERRIERPDGNIRLAFQLERQLQTELQVRARVHVSDDQVQLFGNVSSWYLKQQVQELVREGVPACRIRNELRVRSDFHGSVM